MALAAVPQVTLTTNGCWTTVTVVVAVAVLPFASLTSKDSWKVPLTGSETVKVNGLPAVICPVGTDGPQVTATVKGCWITVTVVVAIALLPLASWTVNDSVKVPFTGSVTVKVPVPWYGEVPPVADTLHWNGLPAVIAADEEPQWTVTTNG